MINSEWANGWLKARTGVAKHRNTTTSSGTYQAAAADYGRLHVLKTTKDILYLEGTGASVSAASGLVLKASDPPHYFRPVSGTESIGYQTLDASSFAAATPLTVGLVE